MSRETVTRNVERKLWSSCGGYCQNPSCRKYLFAEVEDSSVSLANMAHIMGAGKAGPRSEHQLAQYIESNGYDNLIMLCLDCHKIVDELEEKFSVEDMMNWKTAHKKAIDSLFTIPSYDDETELLKDVNDKLDENSQLFRDYGPFSVAAKSLSPDAKKNWYRVCLRSILPNNQYIVDVIEKNKRIKYPWDVYKQMLAYKTHVDSFRENCLTENKVYEYKQFPHGFDHFVKSKLEIASEKPEIREDEEIDFRMQQVETLFSKFLGEHGAIKDLEKRDLKVIYLTLKDGRELRVFLTQTYRFTEYTLEKILAVDAGIDAILCLNPYSSYSSGAKRICIEKGIALHNLSEFMGAINFNDDRFLDCLPSSARDERVEKIKKKLGPSGLSKSVEIYVFGSFLRNTLYNDVDVLIVHKDGLGKSAIDDICSSVELSIKRATGGSAVDIELVDRSRFSSFALTRDNKVRIF